MGTAVLMPALSPTMEEGKLATWLVKEGDKITSGMVIAEIETDKATMEVEAVDEGVLGKILIPAGTEGVRVNAQIALILDDGESLEAALAIASQGNGSKLPQGSASKTLSSIKEAEVTAAPSHQHNNKDRVFASPLARRLAEQNQIMLSEVTGSGPHGRIVKADVESIMANPALKKASNALTPLAQPATAIASKPVASSLSDDVIRAMYPEGSYDVLPIDGMRRTIARRLSESKQTIPHFYVSTDVKLDALLALRTQLNNRSPKEGAQAYKLSVNDFIIKGLAVALQRMPATNVTWTESGILQHKHSDVGVAVSVEGGLFTPVVRRAEQKSLVAISQEMKDLAGRARSRKLKPEEYQGGTTAVSNMGMFGVKNFAAIVNPPHASILAVGAGEQRPVVDNGTLSVATVMSVTLSLDHRAVDGALGAEMLGVFKELIEDPMSLLL
jgi:pyruvate dehydrogenase E2 component (dihydrolipoamide acetyltransferase)